MKNEQFINQLYTNTIEEFLKNVTTSRDELAEAYKSYLFQTYESLEVAPEKYDATLEVLSKTLVSQWGILPENHKMQELLKDEAMQDIRELSYKGLEYARLKISEKQILSTELANQAIQQLESVVDKVKPYNQNLAKELISEGILDYMYAAGLSENTSLRLGHIK
ncbi:MAG: hypothetical protein K2M17_05960 [Bacilli bacterium]|nr:hypothetical protein [Bacilli bacterium]